MKKALKTNLIFLLTCIIFLTQAYAADKNYTGVDSESIYKTNLREIFYQNMLAQSASFQATFSGTYGSSIYNSAYNTEILNDFKLASGNEYCYLAYKNLEYTGSLTAFNTSKVSYTINWRESASQTASVNSWANSKVASITGGSMSDYEKILAIHDFITTEYSYDTTLTKFTAYDLLYNGGKAVCQGFTMLAYRMLTAAGIESRIILKGDGSTQPQGNSGGSPVAHTWNVVKLEGKWYHIDFTWDKPVNGKSSKTFFLKGNTTMSKDHIWDKTFYSFISNTDYLLPVTPGNGSTPSGGDAGENHNGNISNDISDIDNKNGSDGEIINSYNALPSSELSGGDQNGKAFSAIYLIIAGAALLFLLGAALLIVFLSVSKNKKNNTPENSLERDNLS